MTSTQNRIKLLAAASGHRAFDTLIGKLSADDLAAWLGAELGSTDALERFSTHGNIRSKAVAPDHILHIVSGNTPHAAMQSLLRGLLLGSHNTIKLPAGGLPDLTSWIDSLPDALTNSIALIHDISAIDWSTADVVIAIGSDSTIASIQKRIQPHQTFIPHGHKLSIGIVTGDAKTAAELAARDVSLFDQRGCLSLHAVYVDESCGCTAKKFSRLLANAMTDFAAHTPPLPLTISEAGAVHNFRETTRFQAANRDGIELLESPGSLDWTVVFKKDPILQLSCLGRTVHVMPLPSLADEGTLGAEARHLSTIALHPFDYDAAEKITHLPAHRICPLGSSQQPSLFWHHDGFAPLTSMVKWKDIG